MDKLPHKKRMNGDMMMKHWNFRKVYCGGLLILTFMALSLRTLAGGCAVSDGSQLPGNDGCMLAFVYNQEGDNQLVVFDGKNLRQYESPLNGTKMAPFWEGGKVYVLDNSGTVQAYRIGANRLIPEKLETLSTNSVVRTEEYSRGQRRLYLICTSWDDQHRIRYELSAMDFPARKTLWSRRIDDPGPLRIMEPYVCMTGLKQVQVFNCDTGKKIGSIAAVK